jgi:hypothetical protein
MQKVLFLTQELSYSSHIWARPNASHMFWVASHLRRIDHVVVPLSLLDASRGVAPIRFFISLSWHVITRGKNFRTLKLHGSPAGCSSRWTRGFPWQLETARGRIAVHLARKRPVRPSSGLANSLGLTVPWVDCARVCIGESRWIPSVCNIKGGHVHSYLNTNYAPGMGEVFLESHWLVLKIHVNLYIFIFSKCVIITP